MFGFVRRQTGATCFGLGLELTVLVLDSTDTRVVLVSIDTLGIGTSEADELRAQIANVTGAAPEGIVLNWSHTHNAPPANRNILNRSGLLASDGDERHDAYWSLLCDAVTEAATAAVTRLEPAATVWGVGEVDVSVNRREVGPDGTVVHGWNVEGLLDRQVVTLQVRRPDESVIATLVGFGCHPVSVGMDFPGYSSDFPGAMRRRIREWTGGDCAYFQGAAGNVLPRASFLPDEIEAERIGEILALEALHSVSDKFANPTHLTQQSDGSLIPMILFRFEQDPHEDVCLRAAEHQLRLPLQPIPTETELIKMHGEYSQAILAAEQRGAGDAEVYGLKYHEKWVRRTLESVRAGTTHDWVQAQLHAIRIGDGAIVTSPGESFTEIGMAVKQRSPARPTLYAGYTNGAIGYFPTADAYEFGGYEPVYSNRSYGQAATVSPETARLLIEASVTLLESLFPDSPTADLRNLNVSVDLPALPKLPLCRPQFGDYSPPVTAHHPH